MQSRDAPGAGRPNPTAPSYFGSYVGLLSRSSLLESVSQYDTHVSITVLSNDRNADFIARAATVLRTHSCGSSSLALSWATLLSGTGREPPSQIVNTDVLRAGNDLIGSSPGHGFCSQLRHGRSMSGLRILAPTVRASVSAVRFET